MAWTLLHDFLLIFVPLLVAIDPAGTLPLYLSLTARYRPEHRRRIARRATLVAAITGVAFIIVGQAIFAFLGIRFADFQIAGGILLVVLAIIDLLSTGKPAVALPSEQPPSTDFDAESAADGIGIVPLAVPLIVGPATMTTSLLLVSAHGKDFITPLGAAGSEVLVVAMVCLALLANLLILFAAMWHSEWLVRLTGKQAMLVANKIVMILLAAIAVSLIRQGIMSIVLEGR